VSLISGLSRFDCPAARITAFGSGFMQLFLR
jgi:hypothetical protein